MGNPLSIGQDVFCDCGIDILEYTVTEVRFTDQGTFYVLVSKKPVGAYTCLEIVIYQNGEGDLKYFGLHEPSEDNFEYGMEPFTGGRYFLNLQDAKDSYAKTQIGLIDDNINQIKARLVELESRKARWQKMISI